MCKLVDYPLLVFAATFLLLWLSTWMGATVCRRLCKPAENMQGDFGIILGAVLTLAGLIIGFSFSMAINRYEQRKNVESAEANALSTEFVRADLLPAADAVRVRALLRDYFEQRLLFYTIRDDRLLQQCNARTVQLQAALWSAVVAPAAASMQPAAALVASGMNEVLDAQGYVQAAWWNRIPAAAWFLMVVIALCCQVLVGYGLRTVMANRVLLNVLPLMMSVSFFLIADIDSPRRGVIRVQPENLLSIAELMQAP